MPHVQGHTVATGSLSSMKLTRIARRKKRTTKETKPAMKLQTTMRRQALGVVVSPCPPPTTVARVTLVLS